MAVQASSVLWLHNMTCEACVCCAWTKCVIIAKRWLAPWWWFPCKSKHVGAAFLILICFNKLYMCISWTIKDLISLMHGITMKIYLFIYFGAHVTKNYSRFVNKHKKNVKTIWYCSLCSEPNCTCTATTVFNLFRILQVVSIQTTIGLLQPALQVQKVYHHTCLHPSCQYYAN